MPIDRTVTRESSEPVAMRPIVDTQTPVKTLPSLAVGNREGNLTLLGKTSSYPEGGGEIKYCFWDKRWFICGQLCFRVKSILFYPPTLKHTHLTPLFLLQHHAFIYRALC